MMFTAVGAGAFLLMLLVGMPWLFRCAHEWTAWQLTPDLWAGKTYTRSFAEERKTCTRCGLTKRRRRQLAAHEIR